MRRLQTLGMLLVFSPALCFAQKEMIRELQRDVAQLQDEVRSLERSFNEKMGGLTTLVQQNIEAVNKLNTSMAVLDAALRDREKNLAGPITGAGAKMDQLTSEFQAVRVSIEDMNGRLGKLERGMVDLNNLIKVMTVPQPPPPSAPAGGPGSAAACPPQGLTADALYANALRDRSGSPDVALQEFSDYLKCFSDTSTAPNAQYYIGEINYNRKEYDAALQAFDAVLERFPENNKTLDAMYMKGRTLIQMGEKTKGAEEFRNVIRRAPSSELATKAKAQLSSLGLPYSPARKSRKK
jgi:TolA-binding protein